MSSRSGGVDSRRTDTRERALSVALNLFAHQGYTVTSLREIAEQLGVTKAALYFHFRTKEELLTAILRGYLDGVAALVEESTDGQPLSNEGRERLLRRFAAHQEQWGTDLALLVRQNATEIRDLPIAAELKTVMQSVIDALTPAGAGPRERLRVQVALATFHIAARGASAEGNGDEKRMREAALDLAVELVRDGPPPID